MSTESADEIKEDSARKAHYDDLWDRTPSAKVTVDGQETTEYFRVFWKSNSESENLPVKEIPIDSDKENGLWYNADNSRILAYKKKKEAELLAAGENRKLSSANKDDRIYIEDKLLNSVWYSGKATKELEEELKSTGQIDPAIISSDGIIWNANRRTAVRQKLYRDTGDAKWNKEKAVRLPTMSFKALKELEHRLQMQKEFKEEYGSITLRLRCRDALKPLPEGESWTMQELRNSFRMKYTKPQIEKFIEEIKLVDEFLAYSKNPSDYPSIEAIGSGRGVEIFTALADQLRWERANPQNEAGQSLDLLIEQVKHIGFSLVHHKTSTYATLRDFRDILRKEITRKSLLTNSNIIKDPTCMTSANPSVAPTALSITTMDEEMKNLEREQVVYEALKNTPTEVMQAIFGKAKTIDAGRVDQQDAEFRRLMIGVLEKLQNLFEKPNFTDEEKNELKGIFEKFNKKIE